MQESNISFVILAGGKSSRMGQDKSDLYLGDYSFLELQIRKGIELGIKDILVSGYRGDAKKLENTYGVRVVADHLLEKGPLGGLETCLRLAEYNKCMVLSVDVPLVPVSVLVQLIEQSMCAEEPVTALSHGGHQEPLIGVYNKTLADEMLEEITKRKGSVFQFIRRVGCLWYETEESDDYFVNINNPMIYEKYRGSF